MCVYISEGDLYEDGLAMKNGFFRSRRFAKQGSEVGSVDLFSEGLGEELEGMTVEGEEFNSQAEAKRRKDRLEREEFIKCQVGPHTTLLQNCVLSMAFMVYNVCTYVCVCVSPRTACYSLWILVQERDSGVLEMDEDSQSILSMIMDNSSQSMINSKSDIDR